MPPLSKGSAVTSRISAMRRRAASSPESAMICAGARKRDRKRGVPPDSVIVTMERTPMCSDRNIAAMAMAWSARSRLRGAASKSVSCANWRSAPRQTRAIASTAFSGYLPAAVSCESITASVPSMTEFATSSTSARVGMGLSTIDCSICVAVMTTRLASSASRMIFFCRPGSSASPISTPRSPRATITTSEASTISRRFSMASARSIFDTSAASLPAARAMRRASCMSCALRQKDTAMKSTPIFAAMPISSSSLGVSAPSDSPPPCLFRPLRLESTPSLSTVQRMRSPSTASTCSCIIPSSSSSTSPATTSPGRPR